MGGLVRRLSRPEVEVPSADSCSADYWLVVRLTSDFPVTALHACWARKDSAFKRDKLPATEWATSSLLAFHPCSGTDLVAGVFPIGFLPCIPGAIL